MTPSISSFEFEQMQERLGLNVTEPSRKRIKGDVAAERKLHEQIEAFCKSRLWPYVHSRMDKKSTTGPGSPDFCIVADRGRVLLIECKADSPSAKLSPEQRIFIAMAKKLSTTVHIVRDFDQFMEAVK